MRAAGAAARLVSCAPRETRMAVWLSDRPAWLWGRNAATENCSACRLPAPGSRRRRFVVLGIHHHGPASRFARALGLEIILVAQRQVKYAAFTGGHGAEGVRHAGFSHPFSRYPRRQLQFLQPHGAVIHAVEGHAFMFGGREPQDLLR